MSLHPAVRTGLNVFLWLVGIGLLVGFIMGQLLQNADIGWFLAKRMAVVGVGLGLASGIVRYWQPTTAQGQLIGRDWGNLGALAGIMLAGWITEQGLTSSSASRQTKPGEVLQISGPTLSGTEFSLEQTRGKVTLVDFWATWCGPCIAELPNVKQAYARFHDAGLEIVGVSFDEDRESLEQFVQEEQLPWPQIIFAEESQRGFANPNGVRYQVDSIPDMMLVDREGRLLARKLRGSALEREIRQALGVPGTWGQWLVERFWGLFNWLALGIMSARWFVVVPLMVAMTLLFSLAFGRNQQRATAES